MVITFLGLFFHEIFHSSERFEQSHFREISYTYAGYPSHVLADNQRDSSGPQKYFGTQISLSLAADKREEDFSPLGGMKNSMSNILGSERHAPRAPVMRLQTTPNRAPCSSNGSMTGESESESLCSAHDGRISVTAFFAQSSQETTNIANKIGSRLARIGIASRRFRESIVAMHIHDKCGSETTSTAQRSDFADPAELDPIGNNRKLQKSNPIHHFSYSRHPTE